MPRASGDTRSIAEPIRTSSRRPRRGRAELFNSCSMYRSARAVLSAIFRNMVTSAKPNLTNVLSFAKFAERDSPGVVAFCLGGPGKLELRKFLLRKGSEQEPNDPVELKENGSRRLTAMKVCGKRLNNDFNGAPPFYRPFVAPLPRSPPPLDPILPSCLAVFPRPTNLVGCKLISRISYATVH